MYQDMVISRATVEDIVKVLSDALKNPENTTFRLSIDESVAKTKKLTIVPLAAVRTVVIQESRP